MDINEFAKRFAASLPAFVRPIDLSGLPAEIPKDPGGLPSIDVMRLMRVDGLPSEEAIRAVDPYMLSIEKEQQEANRFLLSIEKEQRAMWPGETY